MRSTSEESKRQSRRQILHAIAAASTVGMVTQSTESLAKANAPGQVATPHSASPSVNWVGKMRAALPEWPAMQGELGMLASFETSELPLLKDLTVRVQYLAAGAAREPHWHAGKVELNYVLEGEGEIGIQEPSGELIRIPVKPGSATFIPSGRLHYILNTGGTIMRLLISFNDISGRSFNLSSSLGAFGSERTAQSLNIEPKALPAWTHTEAALYTRPERIAPYEGAEESLLQAQGLSIDISAVKASDGAGARSRTLRTSVFPVLDGLSLRLLELEAGACKGMHWHPQGDELTYVAKGEVEFGLMAPGNTAKTDIFRAKAGEAVNIPEGWLHYIANVGTGQAELYVFWNVGEIQEAQLANVFFSLPAEISAASGQGNADLSFFESLLGKTPGGMLK